MKILVTGGAGFIGSHVVDAYIANGHRVAVIDDLPTGSVRNLNPRARFYKTDIRNAAKILAIFKKERPDIVNHHAASIEVTKSLRDPIQTLNVNVIGTANVALAAGNVKIKKFIFASTGGAIYGEPARLPARESTPAVPLSPYGLSKLISEDVIKFYGRLYGFPYTLLRYSNVYGPRQNPNGEAGIIAIFGKLMKAGKRPTIFGDGTKTRDYVFVGDVVRANLLSLTKGRNETLNIGRGIEVSDQQIFDSLAYSLNFSRKPVYAPFRKGEVRRVSISPQKAKTVLGWRPKTSLNEGIKKTLRP